MSPYLHSGAFNLTNEIDPNNFLSNQDFNVFALDPSLALYNYFEPGLNYGNHSSNYGQRTEAPVRRLSGKRVSGGILDRVTQFENLSMKTTGRPHTPQDSNSPSYLLPTPESTPCNRKLHQAQTLRRFQDDYDTSMEETIKPKNNQRARGIFEDMRKLAEESQSSSISAPSTFDMAPTPTSTFLDMSSMNMEFLKTEPSQESSQYSPISTERASTMSYPSSPEMSAQSIFGQVPFEKLEMEADGIPNYASSSFTDDETAKSPRKRATHGRSESVSSIPGEIITETGITLDDIASFISGPDPADNKWICLYPECNKRFGRKENIKSHVQTHLGDRQFQCIYCKKCFVRQHDLKRHAKIHSGVKPYPCRCGNSFARHDALTRHRQRGMCIGAFEGVVKKVVKRGRPKKHRPDDEERLNKSAKQRIKNKAMSSGSSTSSGSESSASHSPRDDHGILDEKPFEGYGYSQATSSLETSSSHCSSTQSSTPVDCISPQDVQTAHSPSTFSTHSVYSQHPGSVIDNLPSHPTSPAKSVYSQYHSPPELCESSSSPAASATFYDLEENINHGLDLTSIMADQNDDLFLDAFAASNEMTQLERDPSLLLGKLEDGFDAMGADEMFRNDADMFFGSP
ncbi:hypothetical protein F5884DRAFT_660933 [Xylogone sp. PMI_703]|nr:hypothetical protein F5884DRAFT_660933 [Xylogone sp. PMI_703]